MEDEHVGGDEEPTPWTLKRTPPTGVLGRMLRDDLSDEARRFVWTALLAVDVDELERRGGADLRRATQLRDGIAQDARTRASSVVKAIDRIVKAHSNPKLNSGLLSALGIHGTNTELAQRAVNKGGNSIERYLDTVADSERAEERESIARMRERRLRDDEPVNWMPRKGQKKDGVLGGEWSRDVMTTMTFRLNNLSRSESPVGAELIPISLWDDMSKAVADLERARDKFIGIKQAATTSRPFVHELSSSILSKWFGKADLLCELAHESSIDKITVRLVESASEQWSENPCPNIKERAEELANKIGKYRRRALP